MKLLRALTLGVCLLSPSLAEEASILKAEITGTPFKQYLTYQTYRVETSSHQTFEGGFVYGPGHHAAAIAALVLDEKGMPYAVFKRGDTRLSRAERKESYVKVGWIAGRLDKPGASGAKIALDELAEEVGGAVVEGSFRRLGDKLSCTMPFESTEGDSYFSALVQLSGKPYGDGGSMEVVGLIGPLLKPAKEALIALDGEEICDSGRARTMYARNFDAIGFIPQLGVYVQDHPKMLRAFNSLGMGTPIDPRPLVRGSKIDNKLLVPPKPTTQESRINDVICTSRRQIPLNSDSWMVAAKTRHAIRALSVRYVQGGVGPGIKTSAALGSDAFEQNTNSSGKDPALSVVDEVTPLLKEFPNEYLHTNYDRAKVVVYFLDPVQGPVVVLNSQVHPVQAFGPKSDSMRLPRSMSRKQSDLDSRLPPPPTAVSFAEVTRLDVSDRKVARDQDPILQLSEEFPGKLRRLGAKSGASGGQSDLYYHYLACETTQLQDKAGQQLVTLSEAIRLCRTGDGDSQTEAALVRLADSLNWIPSLQMDVEQAKQLLKR
jgi:hypothetical protein